jgi:hypothetical protein
VSLDSGTPQSIRQSLFAYLDSLSPRNISGWDLFAEIQTRTGRNSYPATLLGYAREYSAISGARFDCVDPERSIYRFEPSAKIAGAIVD